MKRITKADIVRVANQYLGGDFLVIKKVKGKEDLPKIAKPGITPVKVDPSRRGVFAKVILDMPVTPIEPVSLVEGKDYQRGTLPTGPLISVANTRNGLFTLSFAYDFGRADDRFACLALEILKVSGAGKRTAEQVTRSLHELGISVDTGCSKDGAAITVSGVDRNLEAGMALVREWLADPVTDDATVKKAVASAFTERANTTASPQAISSAAAQFARYGADSELLVVPSNSQLRGVKPAQLKKLLGRFLELKHRTAYFGPRSQNDAIAAITLGTGKTAARKPLPTKFRAPGAVYAIDQDTAQTQIWLIWPRKPANDNERAIGTVFSAYAGPVLYQEVREARGLAYSVYGYHDPGSRAIDDASVLAYVGTQRDKTHDALDAVFETLRNPVDDKRLETAKETLAQNHRVERIAPRAIANVVQAWDEQGAKSDPRDARVKRALAVDKVALETWLHEALARKLIVSLAGNRSKLDEAKLRKLAPVTWVPIAKLFGY